MDAIDAGVSSRQQQDFLSTTDLEDFTREKNWHQVAANYLIIYLITITITITITIINAYTILTSYFFI